ncbi:hypothetical protein J6590_056539 [Homalodisca vitripennis]|nr:hypothetical protein J6590_056539 [Homalodisca vitripennis]
MKNWYSPIMMERFGRGVAMSWRVNNIKTEEQGGVEDGKPKSEEMLFNLTSDIDVPGQSRPFEELLSNHEMDQEMLFNLTSDIDVPGQSRPFDELLSNHQMDQEMSRSFKEKILEEFLDMTTLALPYPSLSIGKTNYVTHEKSIVIRTQEFTIAIHPEDKGCNQNTLPLCLIPRATVNSDQSLRCLHSILNTSTLPTLRATCAFTCFNETPMPLVTQVSPNKFFVTNIQTNLEVVCSHQKNHHYIQKPNNTGTLEIILPCECSLHQEELTLINTVIPCGSKNPDNYQTTHLLPISWSKFHSITILPLESETRQEFQHLHEILDENWTLSTPTYFVHNLQRQHHFQLNHDEKT